MWSAVNSNTSQTKRTTPNLKQLKLISKAPEPSQRTLSPPSSDVTAPPETWLKEFRLISVVERERKKLSTFTSSSTSTSASSSSSSSREPTTPLNLPHLNSQLLLLDEKLEIFENKITAREHLFDILGKDSDRLHLDLQRELRRASQSLPSPTPLKFGHDEDGNPSQALETIENIQEAPSKVEDASAVTGQVAPDSDMPPTVGWGDYFKKLW